MALLQMVSEEDIHSEHVEEYFGDLYRVVCVGERVGAQDAPPSPVRTTYLVDWEQLVHLLEDYLVLGEDIVEVTRVSREEARVLRGWTSGGAPLARA